MTIDTGIPIFGPCVAMLPGDEFSLVFPIREATAEMFSLDELELAARICLYDNLPAGREVDENVPVRITWGRQQTEGPMDGNMSIVHLLAKLKEAS